ncbi:hypothetical protein [Phycicoccus jejuensis]|uniref:hypothetical protein n=1 Tax=Phycicoccus jejuensis TaxID=367299 RepID=UPI0004C3C454|nr:hypothetical protein [Phycicoccus jejuensis]
MSRPVATRRRTRGVLAGAVAVLAGVAFAVPAQASDQSWSVSDGGALRARASFDDAANRVYVTESRVNDGVDQYNRGAVIDVWRAGNKGGTHVKCYSSNGGSDQCALIWVEDTPLEGELCWIEAYFSYKCSPIKDFYS